MRYIPLTSSDRDEMLDAIGVGSVADLFSSVPASIRFKGSLNLPSQKTESELKSFFRALSDRNLTSASSGWRSFLGGGAYEHFIPTVVDAMSSRGEFSTAYTPYQPEVSQGTLQVIFEFQSMVANLFGMDVANASMYDGASALAEAVLMSMRLRPKGKKILVSKGVHPEYRKVIASYVSDFDVSIQELDLNENGHTVLTSPSEDVVTLVVQQPNFFGLVENIAALKASAHSSGALLTVTTTEALAFGVLKGPGELGADIVAGEGQSLGNPLSFGGPYVGLFATKNEFLRQVPGRLVGKTIDEAGLDGYCLTLATREQHIRREKATSNICTNHSLCALRAAVYMALMGKKGLRDVAFKNAWLAKRLREKLSTLPGIEFPFKQGVHFNEFVIRLPISTAAFLESLEKDRILGGIPLSKWELSRDRDLLVTVTETKSESDLNAFVDAAKRAL